MVKAFDVFGVKMSHFRKLSNRNDSDESDSDSSVNSFQSEDVENEPNIILSRHIRCCAHTLSLCATNDIMKTIKSSPHLHEMHTKVMQKCNTLWNAASRPKSAEIIQSVLGHTLSRPGDTRWNSLFDSLTQIQKIKEKFSELTKALDLKQCSFTVSDHNYIEEFLFCLKPLSQALDILQGDKNVFYGMVFPTLLCLQRKLMVINSEQLMYCKLIRKSLLDSIEKRFSNILSFKTVEADNAAIATFSHPKFKNKWLNCIHTSCSRDKLLSIFKKAVTAEFITTTSDENFEIEEDHSDFYDFGPAIQNDTTDTRTSTMAEIEVCILN